MNPKRKLVLRRETLADLDDRQLRAVAGGTHIVTDCGCLTHGYTCDVCEVDSVPINACLRYTVGQLIRCTDDETRAAR